jgi:hypothetical protein
MTNEQMIVVRRQVREISDKIGVYLKGESFAEGTLAVFAIDKPDLEESFPDTGFHLEHDESRSDDSSASGQPPLIRVYHSVDDASASAIDFARSLAAGTKATAP